MKQFWKDRKFKNRIYDAIDEFEDFDQKIKLIPIDFKDPWWKVITQKKAFLIISILNEVIGAITAAVTPVLIGVAISEKSFTLLGGIILFNLVELVVYNLLTRVVSTAETSIELSVSYTALRFFVTTDPIHHTTKSSGQIISKINRGSRAYETFLDTAIYGILYVVINVVTVSITMAAFGFELGLIAISTIILVSLFNVFAQILSSQIFQTRMIKTQDKASNISTETMIQAPFIRSIYASDVQMQKIFKKLKNSMITLGNVWQVGNYINGITRSIYLVSYAVIGYFVLARINAGSMDSIIGFSILITYINNSRSLFYIGHQIKSLTTSITDIRDLYSFIREFGQQTYPVLEGDEIKNS